MHEATLSYYERNARAYSTATNGLSMAAQLDRFLTLLQPGDSVLDVGCGSGRDLLAMRAAGMNPTGLEISPSLAAIAREHSGVDVVVGDMREPPFDAESFHGIWASASLLHAQRDEVPPILKKLRRLLRSRGCFFASVKAGAGADRAADGRWFTYFEASEWRQLLADAGFLEIEIECDRPASPAEPSSEGWIQSFCRAP